MSLSNPSDISNSDPSTIAQDRKTCWIARDQFFSCLNGSFSSGELYTELKASKDTSDILPKSLRTPCDKLRDIMYSSCPHSWADHFEKKFRGDKLKEYQLIKLKESGAQPL